MKRIKSVNGYTIYEATTQRDVDNYNCEIGNYNVYISTDIRDYGLTCSYPEWENEDSLAVCIARCAGSHYAVAAALADELSDSTVQDMDLTLEIERRLESGEALNTIRQCYDRETGRLYSSISEAINAGYDPYMDELSALDSDPYDVLGDSAEGFDPDGLLDEGDLEDVLEAAMAEPKLDPMVEAILDRELEDDDSDHGGVDFPGETVRDFIASAEGDDWYPTMDELSDAMKLCGVRLSGPTEPSLYDQVHARFDERDYHDRARFTAHLAEIADELGLTQEQVDGFTSDWELWFEAAVPVYHSNALLEEGCFSVDPSLDMYREELAAGVGSEETCNEIETCGIWGRAVLEIGYADIELNITRPEGNRIVAEYFCCLKQADGDWFDHGYIDREADIDWTADNWQDLLHDHMRRTLLELSAYDPDMDFSTPFVDTEYTAWAGLYEAEQCPVEEEPEPEEEPKQERRSHASYAVLQDPDDGQYYTISAPSSEGFDTQARRDDWLLCTVAKHHAFNDCGGYDVLEVVVDGRRVEYVGWQPGMLYEFADCETGEIVWSASFPEWDH